MSGIKKSTKRLFWKLLSLVVVAVSIFFFVNVSLENFQNIPEVHWSLATLSVVFFSLFFSAVGVLLLSLIWRTLYVQSGNDLSILKAQIIVSISQIGKYFPGNVGQHVGRVALSQSYGLKLTPTMAAMFMEMVFGVAVACVFGAFALYFLVSERSGDIGVSIVELVSVSVILFLLPWLSLYVAQKLAPALVERLSGQSDICLPSLKSLLVVVALFSGCFLLFGIILKLQSIYFFDAGAGSVVQFTCLFALAWVIGYIVPGAPGGLGVRESAMIILMSPLIGEGAAIALSVSLRLTTTIGDAAAFFYGVIIRHYFMAKDA